MHTELRFEPGIPLPLVPGETHRCPYLAEREARELFALPIGLDARLYRLLMDAGFRRAGGVFYRPECPDCRECRVIRVPAADFRPSRSQRRVLRRNADVEVRCGPLTCDEHRWKLYQRYQIAQHDGDMLHGREDFEEFLGRSPISSFEMTYHVDGRLVGVGVVDEVPDALSSVYFYFDPAEHRRSLGVFSGLCEIEECRRRGLAYWYLGYMIAGCRKMEYKTRFRPYELRNDDGVFVRHAMEASS
ncbi:MAG: arginyltransferase [Planctomycetota bacterium]|nr:MAG: arginyltransferase [Planctomycetota bacterium]